MTRGEIKSFTDLVQEVQAPGLCGACGGCVSFCSAGELNALCFGSDGFPEYADEDRCLKCGICYLVCPQVKILDHELGQRFGWEGPSGPYRSIRSAKTTDSEVMAAATDGGVVTALLIRALENGIIDGAIVSRRIGPFSRQPAVATTREELIEAAGSHFGETAHLGEMGKAYTSFVPAIQELGKLRNQKLGKLALVGTPCQIYSLRKMQLLRVVPSDAIRLVIGLFCMESFAFTDETRAHLEERLGVPLDRVVKLNVKDDVILTASDGEEIHVPFEVVDEIARPACMACPDFASDFADLSCGGLGSPAGYTTVVIRTAEGEKLYSNARRRGFIEEAEISDGEAASLHRTTMVEKIKAFSRAKRARAEERLGVSDA